MRMAIKVSLVLGMVLLICSWTVGVLAQERREEHPKQLQEVLGLTDTQVTAIRAEQQAAEVRMRDLRVQVQKFEEQIYQAAEETGNPTTVGKLVLQKIAVQKQFESEEAGFRERIFSSVLTPQQQDKLKQLMEADQLSRGWDALLMGRGERQQRHEGVPGGGGAPRRQPHPERMPEK